MAGLLLLLIAVTLGNSTMVRLAVLLVVLSGCATSKEISTAEGKPAYSIQCRALFLYSFDCMEKAQQLCGVRGFNVLKGSEPSTTFAKNMMIECR
jgi:hypothetical protein